MISVVMATYNRADTLPRAVDSVLRQSHKDWELLIVDDGSTDATHEVLESLDDPRIRIYRHPHNRGMHAAKNTGLDHLSGEWFTTLDSDDEMVPEALEVLLACAERTGATAVTCNCIDTATGQLSGSGPTADGWLTPEQTARCRGDFWGLTQTSLLGDLRFDERLRNYQAPVWIKINRSARRFYLHRGLAIIHTEGDDRVTRTSRTAGLRQKTDTWFYVGEDVVYLRELKRVNSSGHRHVVIRVWAARLLRPLLGLLPSRTAAQKAP
jgi:glycosyltransferase involved in cell wall biosynthesis